MLHLLLSLSTIYHIKKLLRFLPHPWIYSQWCLMKQNSGYLMSIVNDMMVIRLDQLPRRMLEMCIAQLATEGLSSQQGRWLVVRREEHHLTGISRLLIEDERPPFTGILSLPGDCTEACLQPADHLSHFLLHSHPPLTTAHVLTLSYNWKNAFSPVISYACFLILFSHSYSFRHFSIQWVIFSWSQLFLHTCAPLSLFCFFYRTGTSARVQRLLGFQLCMLDKVWLCKFFYTICSS